MRKIDPRFVRPRKLLSSEKPSKRRDANILRLKNRLLADQDRQAGNWTRLEKGRDRAISEWETKRAAKRLSAMRRRIPTVDQVPPDPFNPQRFKEFIQKFRHQSWKDEFYKDLAKGRHALGGTCSPDIDQMSPFVVKPGWCIELWGTCFGASQGKVLFEIAAGPQRIELEVVVWTDTYIAACLNPLVTALRPYSGRVWVQTGAGATSSVWPLAFEPIRVLYFGTIQDHLGGGVFGDSKNDIALEDKVLNDPDFTIESAELVHWGDGWAELRSPYAGGNSFAQGYHIGVAAWGDASVRIGYRLIGPRDVPLPVVPIAFGIIGEIG